MNPLVLVIDEDPRTPTLLLGTAPLSETRFDVRAATDGERAVRALSERMPDLLVLSADMPDDVGWDTLLGQLRKAGCVAPAILVTRTTEVSEERAFRLGVRDVLRKPLNAPVLRGALTSALKDVRYRQEVRSITSELGPVVTTAEAAAPEAPTTGVDEPTSREFDVLYAIGKSVTSLTDLDEILHRVVDAAVYLAGAEQGGLMLLDEAKDELVIRAAKNIDEKIARTLRLRANDSIAGQVVQTGKSVLIRGDRQTKIKTAFLVRSALYVPLKVGDEVLGVLSVDNQRSSRSFSARDERSLAAMADYAAIAIRNAQLYAELRDRNLALESALHDLEAADKLKDSMVQNLSHELRTPLVFIKGFIYMLYDGEFGPLSGEITQGLRTALSRVDDLVKIVENTVALTGAGEFSVEADTVVLPDLIRRVLKKHEQQAANNELTVVDDMPAAPLLVVADPKLLEQVLHNLVDNAIKFSRSGGLVTVSARSLDSSMAEVVVSDSGVGIPPDKVERVFDRFFQVDPSATRKYGGTGLGLAAARKIIQAHGGELTVDSHPAQGSVFRFTLQRAVGKPPPTVFVSSASDADKLRGSQ